MTPTSAAKLLRVALDTMTAEGVRAASREAFRRHHPDTGSEELDGGLEKIKLARRVLMEELEERASVEVCRKCGGSGELVYRKKVTCPTCQGSGEVRRRS